MTLYHVTPKWDGKDLESAASKMGEVAAIEIFLAKWQTEDDSFAQDQVTKVYFYNTINEAISHQETYGGEILAIDETYLDIAIDEIEGYPTCRRVSASDIKRI
jgi:hypothetical protein